MRDFKVEILNEGINFVEYPFLAASIYPHGLIAFSNIDEYIENFIPPAIKTKTHEILFVPETVKEQVKSLCTEKCIPVVSRDDNWSFILEPFLDTEFTEDTKENCYIKLEENGISRQLCDNIRSEVEESMLAYNFDSCLWEWVYLGLFDLLNACSGILSGSKHRLNDEAFKDVYNRAMKITLSGRKKDPFKRESLG